ncbi:succinylglutamate desuccinylase/aspartoacylase family protein [Aquabacter sp. CN5-332]|uniref:succinylglutamate desuccinylase/aspartoacylase family protein n=1 Tax=Aquabacter sp. CN5-332 TaxID=3156608 RepID=UPI0032B37E29
MAQFEANTSTRTHHPLGPADAAGHTRSITVLRFGEPGARPKAYLQAGLHADEFPGMLVLRHLAARLEEAAAKGEVTGEVVLVPQANPIGLSQHRYGFLQGRFEDASGSNFNRDYPDLAAEIGDGIGAALGPDPLANVAAIRAAMGAALARDLPMGELAILRHTLMSLAFDADMVLDLHADNEALLHLYLGTPLWPGAADLAAELDARAVLLAEISGGNPFDEACGGPWWALAKRFSDHPIPPACLSATVELRSNDDVDDALARDDAAALYRFLQRRGVVRGAPGALPRLLCEATPLDAMQQVRAPAEGLICYRARLGDRLKAGDVIAEIIDPLGASVPVPAATDGLLFARHSQTYAWPGKVIAKVAGAVPLPDRTGYLLTE